MLKNFTYQLNTRFFFGDDAEQHIAPHLCASGVKTVLIHHDDGDYLYTDKLLDKIRLQLTNAGIKYVELGGVQPNPRLPLIQEGIRLARQQQVDWILAIGGGSVIDSAKAIAAGVPYSGDVWDFFTAKAKVNKALPVAVLLTNPASGSESSPVMVVYNPDKNEKILVSSTLLQPAITFMNPELTRNLPLSITSNGVVDMFSHIAERYFTNDREFGIIDGMAEGAMRSIVDIGCRLMKDSKSYSLRAEIMWAATIAHNDTVGVGRTQDWATHVIANELSALYDTPHGVSLTVIMPAWMKYVYHNDIPRFARFARLVMSVNESDDILAAETGIQATIAFFKNLNMPVSFSEANIPDDNISLLTDMVQMPQSGLLGAVKKLTRDDVCNIFKLAAQ